MANGEKKEDWCFFNVELFCYFQQVLVQFFASSFRPFVNISRHRIVRDPSFLVFISYIAFAGPNGPFRRPDFHVNSQSRIQSDRVYGKGLQKTSIS